MQTNIQHRSFKWIQSNEIKETTIMQTQQGSQLRMGGFFSSFYFNTILLW